MKKTKKIIITTFWLDWLLFPIVLVAAWLALQWALSYVSQTSSLGTFHILNAYMRKQRSYRN